ncbi:histidinol dehydrogenase-domain-containing protein [Pavlovales sp. CCMP2436]|nr:histidinol dehydrogenase-domain-containing protein [Pavlovales sp. CCMP2436]
MAPILRRLAPSEIPVIRRDPVDPGARDVATPIVEAVKARGMEAVREYAEKFGELQPGDQLIYTRADLGKAWAKLDPPTQKLLVRTVHRVRRFALVQKAAISDAKLDIPGGSAGHTVAPVENAGCYAPGGRYPLPSSVIMTVTTARVAGCTNVWVASPRPTPVTLGAAFVAGADALLAAGGAHAIAALAYGCGPVGPADAVCGPGNQYVTAAKSLIAGRVAIDMLAGPSELCVIADHTASAKVVASDLLAQAEHDPQALPQFISTSEALIAEVEEELLKQLAVLPTAAIAREACKNGYAVLVGSVAEAIEISDRLAPEHLELHVENAETVAQKCKHYGGLFIGHAAAEVLGDYGAGPNHTLPTGGTARSTGGLSVFTFLRIRTWLHLNNLKTAADLVRDAHELAKIEGLHGHAAAATHRLDEEDARILVEGFASAEGALMAHSTGIPAQISSVQVDGAGHMLLALPKKGRLAEMCLKFVEAAGLQYHRRDRLDVAPCTNLPITLVFLPAKDIASFIGKGNVDAGITGQDMVAEADCTVSPPLLFLQHYLHYSLIALFS